MFAIPPPLRKKYFVVVGEFGPRDWYLFDIIGTHPLIERQWVNHPKRAIQFNTEDEAEQIAELVCGEDEFHIQGFTKFP